MEKIAIIPAPQTGRQEMGMHEQPQASEHRAPDLHVAQTPAVPLPIQPEPIVIRSKPTWTLEQGQPAITGLVGLFTLALCAVFTASITKAPYFGFLFAHLSLDQIAFWDSLVCGIWGWRYPLLCGLVGLSMIAVEMLYVKSYRRHFDFGAPRTVDSEAWVRIRARGFALFCCLVPITFLYVYLGEYSFFRLDYPSKWYYVHFRTFYLCAVPTLLTLCWPYYWLLERYGKTDGLTDELLTVARWIRTPYKQIRSGDPLQNHTNAHVANFARGLAVKFFFVPVMVTFCWSNWNGWEYHIHQVIRQVSKMQWATASDVAVNIHYFALSMYALILLVDVTQGLLGYILSTRLLDTQLVSSEPTWFGWFVAIVNYPPIQPSLTAIYLEYSGYDIWPESLFQSHPTIAVLATVCSLLLMGIYAWATVAFGLRFSNLTNRGVVCCGPYAFVRHPAYICKNTAWWIEAVPGMLMKPAMIPIFIMHLVVTNVIYGLRALTEERHLMREPHYQEYCKKVPWRFIPGLW